ncbi:pentatricopeptide repeat-containing protein [Pyrus ussuriensis x Pyrus communis]|uniref:Pentatricopeptide repeat-containing protein n=1 Tax=Pyrus ussuriensis x Pyrus communis TaxID=2448454 RepID=A0A5N5HF70_9ROSA|nr:pentatricopeptide repeat-containing protein [Pyrus ussuriensis x Pyrus communis]
MKVERLKLNGFCKWERKWTEVERLGCGNDGMKPRRSIFCVNACFGAGNAKESWKGKGMHGKVCGTTQYGRIAPLSFHIFS